MEMLLSCFANFTVSVQPHVNTRCTRRRKSENVAQCRSVLPALLQITLSIVAMLSALLVTEQEYSRLRKMNRV